MAIIETKSTTRPNTSVEFPALANTELNAKITAGLQPYIDAGQLSRVRTVSDDNLTETLIYTFDSLDTFSKCDTVKGIELDQWFKKYITEHGFPNVSNFYKLEGIDAAFSCVVKYSFPEGTNAVPGSDESWAEPVTISDLIADGIQKNNLPAGTITSIDVDSTSVTLTLHYENAADFTTNLYHDIIFAQYLDYNTVTRTITYTAL